MKTVTLAITLRWLSWITGAAADFSPYDIEEIISMESKYCPEQMCKDRVSNVSKVIQKRETKVSVEAKMTTCMSCQYRCLCDDKCGEFGDCCTNKALSSGPSIPEYDCVSVKIKTEAQRVFYFMIAKCPRDSNFSNKTLWNCEHPSKDNPKTILPVKSRDRNEKWTTYRNQYCALCHDVAPTDMTSWNVFIDCSQFLPTSFSKLKSFDDAIAFVDNNPACKFQFMPLVGNRERKCKVYASNIISTCNVTGNWLEFNKTVEEYCLGYLAPIRIEAFDFSNLFCAVCNLNDREQNLVTCNRPVQPGPEERIVIPPLSMLINFNPTQDSEPEIVEIFEEETICNCSKGFIFDNYSDSCRELLCPETLHIDGTECTSIVGSSTGLTFSLSFKLTPESKLSVPDTDHRGVAESLAQILDQKLNPRLIFLKTELSFRNNATDSTLLDIGVKMYMIIEEAELYKTFSAAAIAAVNSEWTLHLNQRNHFFAGMMNQETEYVSENSSTLFLRKATLPIQTVEVNGTQPSPVFSIKTYVLIHEIEEEETRMFVTSGTFLILRVSSLFNCSQVSYSNNEYNDDGLSEFWLNVSGNVIGTGQYERFSDGTVRTCSYLIQNDNLRGCHNITTVNTSLSETLTSGVLSAQGLVTLLALSISLLCLILTLITYLLFKELRTLPGKNTMMLIITLILAQIVYLLGAVDTHDSAGCKTVGVLLHYFWLASFFWMNVCSLHVFLIFRDILRSRGKGGSKRLCFYSVYAFTMPGVIVALTIVCFHVISGGKTIGYGQTSCYLSNPMSIGLAFALPLGLIITANIIFFIATLRALREAPRVDSNQENRQSSLIYIRLSSLTGVTWILGFIAAWVQEEFMWYIFIIFCGGQGVYIFFAFICNKRVFKLYRRLLCGKRGTGKKRRCLRYSRQQEGFDSSGRRTTSDTFGDSYQTSRTKQMSLSS